MYITVPPGDEGSPAAERRHHTAGCVPLSSFTRVLPRAAAPQRLDGLQQLQRPGDVLGTGSVGIVGPRGQPLYDDVGRRTEQDDVVEPRIELPLVRGTPGQEQHVGVSGGQERFDAIFSPNPVLSGIETGLLVTGDTDHFLQPPVVGVGGVVAASGKFRNHRRFPSSRHAGDEHPFHVHDITFACSARSPLRWPSVASYRFSSG
jgi:hypothetical protein